MIDTLLDQLHTHKGLLLWLGSLSGILLVLTLIAVPVVVARLPADYFVRRLHPRRPQARQHPLLRLLVNGAKNLLGALLVLVGLALLVLPGQGLLTIAIGIMLMNFPGKYRLERWLVSRAPLLRAINWLRRRSRQPPLQAPDTQR